MQHDDKKCGKTLRCRSAKPNIVHLRGYHDAVGQALGSPLTSSSKPRDPALGALTQRALPAFRWTRISRMAADCEMFE